MTHKEAMEEYGLSDSSIQKYLTDYKRANGLPVKPQPVSKTKKETISTLDMETYMSMTKEELINELIKAKANELRAKKGYEVKGDGANREYISLSNKNTKS